ncbi:hypothetical protein [Anaerovibrio sp. RM50]|uniref:hypothetical protein n=1 Tax=Anaerovibrio sp. RM50 TaxID=1200557 RepID=UPI00048912EA|nr:hypothetical protein [Anaerovibrio sp. RM50]
MLSKNNSFTFSIGVLILVCSFIIVGCGNTTNNESKYDINDVEVINDVEDINAIKEFNIPAPMLVGEISTDVKSGILSFKGAAKTNENSAIFGEGKDTLYVQGILGNNGVMVNVGGKDINNTIPIADPIYIRIYRTSTKDGVTLYIFKRAHDMYCDYLIIGRKTDGTFVKYIDTKEVSLKYFGNLGKQATIIFEDKVLIKGSTLSFNCFYYKFGAKKYPGDKACRFNFNWNEYTQSFDIEQTEQQF